MDKGPGLAFIAYPQALSLMPGASVWSVVFCFMLIPVALGSATCHVETVAAEFVGQFASSRVLVSKTRSTRRSRAVGQGH